MKKLSLLLVAMMVVFLSLYLISCQTVQQSTSSTTTTTSAPTNRPSAPVTSFMSVNLGDAYHLVESIYGASQQQAVNPGTMLVYGIPTDSINGNFYVITGEVMSIMSATSSHNLCGVKTGLSESAVTGLIGSYEAKVNGSSYYYWNYPSINISVAFSYTTKTVHDFGIYNPAKIASPPEWMPRN